MPAATPVLALPYPVAADTADVPRDIQALAVKLDGYSSLRPPLVNALPGSPVDGQECYYQNTNMGTLGVVWHLRYNATSTKWEAVGANSPITHEVAAVNGVGNTSYNTVGFNGPTLAVPLAGDYIVTQSAQIEASVTSGWRGRMSYSANDNECIMASGPGGTGSPAQGASAERTVRRTLTATTLVCAYKSDSGLTVNFSQRYLGITPVRLG